MLDLKNTREHLDEVKERIGRRGQDIDWDLFISLDGERRQILQESESLRAQRNQVSDRIAEKKKRREDSSEEIDRMKEVSSRIKELEAVLGEKEEALRNLMMVIPNLPHESVVIGQGEADNAEVRKWGSRRDFSFPPLAHWDLGETLDILDFDRGAKITGARFTLYKGAGARLERALMNFMLDLHTREHGYVEVLPPFMVNRKSMTGTGQLPKFEEDLFKLSDPDYFLIPTAEVPVTNIHQDEILAEEELPLYYAAYTPCFRREAGSYGKDTRGLIRQHQFNKVELVKFTTPETSYDELEKLTGDAEEVLKRLGIPYRVVMLCTGDLGFSAAKTYDLEAWLPGQNVYKEISSCSNFEDFQARRANIRYRPKGKKGHRVCSHAQWLRPGDRPDAGRDLGKLPAAGRQRDYSRSSEALYGRDGKNRKTRCQIVWLNSGFMRKDVSGKSKVAFHPNFGDTETDSALRARGEASG